MLELSPLNRANNFVVSQTCLLSFVRFKKKKLLPKKHYSRFSPLFFVDEQQQPQETKGSRNNKIGLGQKKKKK